MLKNIFKISILALIIALQSCSPTAILERKVLKLYGDSLESLAQLAEEMGEAAVKLNEDGTYNIADVKANSSISNTATTHHLKLILQDDEALETDNAILEQKGKQAMQEYLDILKSDETFSKYEVVFVKDAEADLENENNFRSFFYTLDEQTSDVTNYKVAINSPTKVDLGTMPEVENQTFENIYIADENICEAKELPLTRFAIEYPNGFEVVQPDNKRDHINIKNKIDNIIVEEFGIGNSTVNLKNKDLALILVEQIANNLKEQLPDLEIISIGKKEFSGESIYVFEGKLDYSAYEQEGYKGVYKIMFLLPLPENNEHLNAPLITFIANEQSEIKSFSDFADKGMIGQVYPTFRFIE